MWWISVGASWLILALLAPRLVLGKQPALSRVGLEDALQLALHQNPTLRAQQFALESTKAGEITAGLRPNPTANFLAEQFGGASDASHTQYTFSVGQPIELGGKRQRRIDSARAATKVAGYQLEDLRRQTILQVKTAFAGALIAREQVALAEDNLKTLDGIEELQRLRVEKGDLSALELLRIQVQRFTFERDVADARQGLAAARIALRAAAGETNIAPDFDVAGELGFKEVPLDRTALRRAALDNRPDLRASEADRERARADHRLARANAWGDITSQIEYQRIGPDNTVGFGFSIPLRIFDRNQGEIARTQTETRRVDASGRRPPCRFSPRWTRTWPRRPRSASVSSGCATYWRRRAHGRTPQPGREPEFTRVRRRLEAMRRTLVVLACLTLILVGRGAANAQDQPKSSADADAKELGLTLSGTPEYTEGKYGTRHTTDILYVPVVLDWSVTDRFDLSLTLPYLREHGRSIFATIGGGAIRTPSGRQSTTDRARTAEGLGDVLLEGNYVLLEEKDVSPEVRAFAEIKFPTADSSKGLGTGAFDEAIGLGLAKKFAKWMTSVEVRYVFVGSPHGTSLDNSVGWSAEVAYDATPWLRLGSMLEGATAVARHQPDPLDLRIVAEMKVSDRMKLKAGAIKGLSNGSPTFGVLAGFEVSF